MTDDPLVVDPQAAPTLNAEQLARLSPFGQRRPVQAGDVLYAEGDATYDFYVVISGVVEVVGNYDGEEAVMAVHGAGRFLGELNLLTGQRVYLTARVVESGEVLVIPPKELRRLIATVPDMSDVILGALVARRSMLLEGAARSVRVIGSRHLPEALAVREFLIRNRLPHQWLDAEDDPDICSLVDEFGLACADLPVVLSGSTVLRRATPGEVAQHLGLTIESIPQRCFDLVVVGAGPAGGSDLGRSMSRYLADRIGAHPAIAVRTGTQVVGLSGSGWGELKGITVATAQEQEELACSALFSFIGASPNSGWLSGCAALDAAGFIRTDRALEPGDLGPEWEALGRPPLPFETSQPGLFAVGDVRSGSMKRVASAVGEGSASVRAVHEHLSVPT